MFQERSDKVDENAVFIEYDADKALQKLNEIDMLPIAERFGIFLCSIYFFNYSSYIYLMNKFFFVSNEAVYLNTILLDII